MNQTIFTQFAEIQKAYETVCESTSLSYRYLSDKEAKSILKTVESKTDNPRFNLKQFTKYYEDPKKSWYGCFRNGECQSLCILKHIPQENEIKDIILLAEIQSIVKGSGKRLIQNVLSKFDNIWWAADVDGGKSLIEYYRQFGLDEFELKHSAWTGTKQTFFYRMADSEHLKILKKRLKSMEVYGKTAKHISLPKDEFFDIRRRLKKIGFFFTTRVSADYGRFNDGDIVRLPWGEKCIIGNTWRINSVNSHPFKDELTKDQISFLSKYSRLKVLKVCKFK